MGFFEAAARRSKRGYRGKLHRCNGAGEAAKVLSRELGTGGGEMSLKSMVSELYGKLANFDLVVDISKYFSTNTAQIFEVKSSADLSG